jgi:hypothetical protein
MYITTKEWLKHFEMIKNNCPNAPEPCFCNGECLENANQLDLFEDTDEEDVS